MRRAVTNDDVPVTPLRWYRSVRAPRLAAAGSVVVVAVATGGVWWALAAIALVPIIVGACASCQSPTHPLDEDDGSARSGESAAVDSTTPS